MSAEALGVAWALDDVTPTQKYVAIAIAWMCREEDGHECYPSHKFLAERTQLSVSGVRKAQRELREVGILYTRTRSDDQRRTSNWMGFTALRVSRGDRGGCHEVTPSKEKEKGITSSSDEDDASIVGVAFDMLRERGVTESRLRGIRAACLDSPTDPDLEALPPDKRAEVFAATVPRLCMDSDQPNGPFILAGMKRTLANLRERERSTTSGKRLTEGETARWVR